MHEHLRSPHGVVYLRAERGRVVREASDIMLGFTSLARQLPSIAYTHDPLASLIRIDCASLRAAMTTKQVYQDEDRSTHTSNSHRQTRARKGPHPSAAVPKGKGAVRVSWARVAPICRRRRLQTALAAAHFAPFR